MSDKEYIFVDNYGELLAQVNDMELISFEEDGGYQGEYLAVLKDKDRLFYYQDYYGSCTSCDWLEDEDDYFLGDKMNKNYRVLYKNALNYVGELKPKFIVPKDKPMQVENLGKYNGFKLT